MTGKLGHGFVAVHCGAGYHPVETRPEIHRACKEACVVAYDILRNNDNDGSALDACVAATKVLEDEPLSNAGIGSNLTLEERIECDAGLMDGRCAGFAGIGCIRNLKNPILACKKLLDFQRETSGFSSLVPPILLAGDGAAQFARKCGLEMVSEMDMITARSLAVYRKALKTISSERTKNRDQLDTVGVIVVDKKGQTAASCSSGGLLLKHPGRIGHAAHFGCGAWAQQDTQDLKAASIAVSCTGCGEYLIRTTLAKAISQGMISCNDETSINTAHVLGRCLRSDFLDSNLITGMDEDRKIAGAVVLKMDQVTKEEFIIDFGYGHCGPSSTMCLAYTAGEATGTTKPKIRCVTSECEKNSQLVTSGDIIRVILDK